MKNSLLILSTLFGAFSSAQGEAVEPGPPSRQEVESSMGLASRGDVMRGQMDTTGFVVTAAQAEDVVSTAAELEGELILANDRRFGTSPENGFLGGVCPHDDHLYAARAYVPLTERITAPRVVLMGVFHAARLWDLENILVFDDFESWHGPWGPVKVDPLKQALRERLPEGSFVSDNAMHCREHSLEAILPFLQHRNREVTIVPILVPYANWEQLSALAGDFSSALAGVMTANGWRLGRDVAIVVSSDAVHYGPDFDHAPFGTDAAAYQRGVDRELDLVKKHLEGPLKPDRLESLLGTLVDPLHPRTYRLPWCGRFSVPFGLEVLRRVAQSTGLPNPEGHFLRSATSLSEPELPVSQETKEAGLGTTAPSNLHHWVGYLAVGFTAGP